METFGVVLAGTTGAGSSETTTEARGISFSCAPVRTEPMVNDDTAAVTSGPTKVVGTNVNKLGFSVNGTSEYATPPYSNAAWASGILELDLLCDALRGGVGPAEVRAL